jgi:hypothetical protein
MSIVETTLIFVGIPAVAILVVAALVYGGAAARTPRYRPGGAWQFEPVWYLPHPEHSEHPGHGGSAANTLPNAANRALPAGAGEQVLESTTASGGASGEW